MELKDPDQTYTTDDDGNTYEVTEYGPEDRNMFLSSFADPNYTQMPNDLLGTWDEGQFVPGVMAFMGDAELRVCLALCRLTYGFHREQTAVSLSWLEKATGMSRQGVLNGIEGLTGRGLFSKQTSPGKKSLYSRTSQRGRPELVNGVDHTSQPGRLQERKNKEREKEKPTTPNGVGPKKKAVSVENGDRQKRVAAALRSTLTGGENDPVPKSKLAEYIGQEMGSPVPAGQLRKLAMGYTEQLANGQQRHHPPPDELWEKNALYRRYVEERVQWYKDDRGSSPAVRRSRLVNALHKFKGNPYAWLEWKAREESGNGRNRPTEGKREVAGATETEAATAAYIRQLKAGGHI